MNDDHVLQGVRAAREAFARLHEYDVRAMVADLRERDDRGDWPVVRLAPRRPTAPSVTPRTGRRSVAACGTDAGGSWEFCLTSAYRADYRKNCPAIRCTAFEDRHTRRHRS